MANISYAVPTERNLREANGTIVFRLELILTGGSRLELDDLSVDLWRRDTAQFRANRLVSPQVIRVLARIPAIKLAQLGYNIF